MEARVFEEMAHLQQMRRPNVVRLVLEPGMWHSLWSRSWQTSRGEEHEESQSKCA